MQYRILGSTGLRVSEIGLGSEVLVGQSEAEAMKLIEAALAAGVNYFDLYNSEPKARSNLGAAMRGRREKFIIQGHLCSAWIDGQYKRTRDMALVRSAYQDLFDRLETDYVDIGMIHFVDEQEDFDRVFGGEVYAYACELKAQGRIRHIGLSTHNPAVAMQAAERGLVEVIMLSINPAYDMLPPSENVDSLFSADTFASSALANIDPARNALYQLCQTKQVALTVMKPYAGGGLLRAETSPFGVALTVPQCLHYCLTRPGVACVLTGARSVAELQEAAAYSELPESARDYASVLAAAPAHAFSDQCMYCGHCAPCTVGIDIATVNKYADLCFAQQMVPETVRDHYDLLPVKAGDCIACGACEANCPFGVHIIEHMQRTAELFGC